MGVGGARRRLKGNHHGGWGLSSWSSPCGSPALSHFYRLSYSRRAG